jgi:predicted membrane protein
VIITATAVCGQIRLIVPEGVAVHMAGRSVLGIRRVRGRRDLPSAADAGVIEVRTIALAGRITVVTPRKSRWPRSRSGPRRTVTGR